MSIVCWLILGLLAGFIASRLYDSPGEDFILDIVLGILGAIVGGGVFSLFGAAGSDGANLYSMAAAIVGAVVVLFIYHAVGSRRMVR